MAALTRALPIALEARTARVTQYCQVVGERVEPDIDDLRVITRYWDAPTLSPRSAAGDAEVFEACLQQLDRAGQDGVPRLVVVLEQQAALVVEAAANAGYIADAHAFAA
jgi:hypothetical protein